MCPASSPMVPIGSARLGTDRSPGTMVFTVSGDVKTPAVAELPMGTPLSFLIFGPGGGMRSEHPAKLIVSGASNRPLTASEIDTPMSFEDMEAIGSGLGSGGFIVYDETTCAVEVGLVLSYVPPEGIVRAVPAVQAWNHGVHEWVRPADGRTSDTRRRRRPHGVADAG